MSDGRIVLTDRPSPTATTERTWQVDVEDRAAARQRALDVKAEAQAVTERVQRSIDQRERLVAAEMRSRPSYDSGYDGIDDGDAIVGGYGYGYGSGYGFGNGYGYGHSHRHHGGSVPPRIGAPSNRGGHFTGSAAPGSR